MAYNMLPALLRAFVWRPSLLILGVVFVGSAIESSRAAGWEAGLSKMEITPREALWMSGYASRNKPGEGSLTPLWAKCLLLKDGEGNQAVLVTLDLIGVNRDLGLRMRERIAAKLGLGIESVTIASSHTHTGPVVGSNLAPMYALSESQMALIDAYAERLLGGMDPLVERARESLAEVKVAFAEGKASLGVNRRNNRESEVPRLREEGKLVGPVDHAVPVLSVRSLEDRLIGLVFGYACHSTTLSSYQWSGDYPGFAQLALELRHPGVVALFWAGCGADINPLPRRQEVLARRYGDQLAEAVDDVLAGSMEPLQGRLSTHYKEVELPFASRSDSTSMAHQTGNRNPYQARRAKLLLKSIEGQARSVSSYPYPVQLWSLGNDLNWVFLGGEVVVDYALRLRGQYGPGATWVAAYCNDVMAYIPSERVLNEGGYEGLTATVYYGLPAPWASGVEATIIGAVQSLLRLQNE